LRKFPLSRNKGGAPELLLAAADLAPLSREFDRGHFDRDDFCFVQGDVTASGVRAALLERGPYTLVLSDAAPATTGNRTVDAGRSLALAEAALFLAEEALERGGNLAVKVFQGEDSGGLLARIKARFERAQSFKPRACRAGSFEAYLVGLGKK
jgi:23S rRNA (uridine2552-2'-O)-methyltransferase